VEFFRYEIFLKAVSKYGTVARNESDEIVRFGLERDGVWSIELGGTDGERTIGIPVPPEKLGERIEDALYASGIAEAAIIPVGPWRNVLDLAAFELAADEQWQDIDAEAALHMNGHDPLALLADRFHIVQTMVRSIVEHGDKPEECLSVVASDAPLVVEARNDGTATVYVMHEAVAREIVKKLQ